MNEFIKERFRKVSDKKTQFRVRENSVNKGNI